ncbi:salivary peroxidase/catechol oxidase [Dermatophagoides farinae]|uniref:Peroxinectin-like protein 7 n=2 Tax=Dermatophagoides farinae TaxID=6954 RepID=A0A9D4P736_DERFA|nr:peroxidase-like isoform X1 [Dermatophagoides farinae]KAH7644884.1 peroxinectin-like protein 7 [Dermatophagoides farinae]
MAANNPFIRLAVIATTFIIAMVYGFSAHTSHISHMPANAEHLVYTSAFPAKMDLSTPLVSGISVGRYNAKREYSPELARIYSRYLANDMTIGALCPNGHTIHDGSSITEDDINEAISFASQQIQLYENANQQYLAIDPRGLNFSAYIFGALLQARFNEFITQYLTSKKCINKYNTAAILPTIRIPKNTNLNQEYCNIDKSESNDIHCDPNYKYRLMNGRCNNLAFPNWGSSFHCHRRLLPPDYSDGINQPRVSITGAPLPSPRLITQFLLPDILVPDPNLSGMNMAWGQFMVHDNFRTIQNLGLAINCCLIPNATVHPECVPITNFPQDEATASFNNQQCINTVRSIACNTCSLGPRDQLNVATQVLDLSNLYGGNLIDDSLTLRKFQMGLMRGSLDLMGNDTLPVRRLPKEQDTLDLTPCNEPLSNPQLTCYHTGDGIRGNQQPGINSIHIMLRRRHNMHAKALAIVNPHWDDEILFQEARRLLIAETQKIHFGEYMPSILGEKLMKYFDLEILQDGYSKYDPTIDPSTIQSVAVASLRMGHSQVFSVFNVINKQTPSYSFLLRNKFFEMSDIWAGNANGILRGLVEEPDNTVDQFVVSDVKNFLFFNPRNPLIVDLPAINTNRGREHGVPAYVYFLEYCTGYQIKSWQDLTRFITERRIKELQAIYADFRDIDLFIGGLSENKAFGSILGPTFGCLNGIQFHHWKFGDRFYFEHGGEAGSFNIDQLNNIRQTSSLANLMCKTTDIQAVQMNPQFRPSETNPKILCATMPEINYELWREYGPWKK